MKELPSSEGLAKVEVAERTIEIVLKDSSIIKSRPYTHTLVNGPSHFILGRGLERKSSKPFQGTIQMAEVDSMRYMNAQGKASPDASLLVCWLKNRTSLSFERNNVLVVKSDLGKEFWCTGTKTLGGNDTFFSGRIPLDHIVSTRTEEFDTYSTVSTVALIVGPPLLVLGVIELFKGSGIVPNPGR